MALKIIDLLKNHNLKNGFSIEVTPALNLEELSNLRHKPTFISITWHAKTHLCQDLDVPNIVLAEELTKLGYNVLIHVSCDLLRREYLDALLAKLKEINVRNIFAIQGDNFDSTTSDFHLAKELVSYIRQSNGDWFCIGVAGYPECENNELLHLKTKEENGADFIITQAFFDAQVYLDFVQRCRKMGLKIPIIPGVFLFENVQQLNIFAKLCKVRLKGDLCNAEIKNGDLNSVGKEAVMRVVKNIAYDNSDTFIHYFTLNKIKNVIDFIDELW